MEGEAARSPREMLRRRFLAGCGFAAARLLPIAGDASRRCYFRVLGDGAARVLMDAPPSAGEDVRPFLSVAGHLRALGLSAPDIEAADEEAGFVLMEDLGDALFARVLEAEPGREAQLYGAATEVLIHLAGAPPPVGAPLYGPQEMADLAMLAFAWYLPAAEGRPAPGPVPAAVEDALRGLLSRLAPPAGGFQLRDVHAENLIWMGKRSGLRRVGLIDFQDAARGARGYDLVSLLFDARRDVDPRLRESCQARFAAALGLSVQELTPTLEALRLQRSLRILGVFARLALRDGKSGYLRHLPRVWGDVQAALAHPALAELRAPLAPLPAPRAAVLQRIRSASDRP